MTTKTPPELSPAPQPPVAEGWETSNEYMEAIGDLAQGWGGEKLDNFISTHKAIWEKARDERAVKTIKEIKVMVDELINDGLTVGIDSGIYERLKLIYTKTDNAITAIEKGE